MLCLTVVPASAETMNYRIKYDGESMVIVPYYSMPQEVSAPKSFPEIESAPVKIPFYTHKLPKGKNKSRSV